MTFNHACSPLQCVLLLPCIVNDIPRPDNFSGISLDAGAIPEANAGLQTHTDRFFMITTLASRQPWRLLFATGSLMLLLAASARAQDSEDSPAPPPTQKPMASITLSTEVKYKEDGTFSDAARAECPLDRQVVEHFSKIASRYQLSLNPGNDKGSPNDADNAVSLRIDHILGGRPGNGFGGRWVISELGVTSTLGDPANPRKSKYHFCSAGLGANPFANLTACQRLQRCTEQISTKIAGWLRQELLPRTQVAKSTPAARTADSAKQTTEDNP